jgi:ribosomal protein L40E
MSPVTIRGSSDALGWLLLLVGIVLAAIIVAFLLTKRTKSTKLKETKPKQTNRVTQKAEKATDDMFCFKCGARLKPHAGFCSKCGSAQS